MRLVCKHCPEEFTSVDIRNEVALKECSDKLCAHVVQKHRTWQQTGLQQLQKATMLLIFLHTMQAHAAIPQTEEFINNEVERLQGELMGLLGYQKEEAKQEVQQA